MKLIILLGLVFLAGCAHSDSVQKDPFAVDLRFSHDTEKIIETLDKYKGFGNLQTVQFNQEGRQVFAAWYCPFSGRAASYFYAYYFDPKTNQWTRFVNRLIEGQIQLFVEMPTAEALVVKSYDGTILLQEPIPDQSNLTYELDLKYHFKDNQGFWTFIIGDQEFKTIDEVKAFLKDKRGATLRLAPGCVRTGDEPLINSEEEMKEFKKFCEEHGINYILVPSG